MIRLTAVRKRYGETVALDGLDLAVARGEVFGLLGPNGAGKSTTMSILTGLVSPDAGEVRVAGGPPSDPAVRARIGLAPQSLALYPLLTGRENVEFFGRMYGLEGRALAQRVDAVLEFVQLADRQRVPAYIVFSDKVLLEMATRRPSSEIELLDISGVGPAKLRKYGSEFLAVLRRG